MSLIVKTKICIIPLVFVVRTHAAVFGFGVLCVQANHEMNSVDSCGNTGICRALLLIYPYIHLHGIYQNFTMIRER